MAEQLEEQKALVVRWFDEVWNKSRREAIDELFAADSILHDNDTVIRGPEEFKKFYDELRSQLDDVQVSIHEVFSQGEMTCARWSSKAREKQSGREITISGISIVKFKDGRFAEAWQNWDKYGLVMQLEERAASA